MKPKSGHKIWTFLESPLFWGFVAIVLTAIGSFVGIPGKLFVLAWGIGTLSIYRAGFFNTLKAKLVGNCIASIFIAIGLLALWHYLRNSQQPISIPTVTSSPGDDLEAPRFVEGPEDVILVFGDNYFIVPTKLLTSPLAIIGEHSRFMASAGIGPIILEISNERVYVSVTVETLSGSIRIERNIIKNEPLALDRNYNNSAMEFSTEPEGDPVFQLVVKANAQIIINGVFRSRQGNVFVATEHGVLEYADPAHMPSLKSILKPIFKHPRWKYPGQYAAP